MFILIAGLVIAYTHISQAVPVDIDPRIVNGTDTDIERYPYMVSLRFDGSHDCGGTVIDEYNILTAAHCFEYFIMTGNLSLFSILAGSTNIRKYNSSLLSIEKVSIHESYDLIEVKPYNNDIAIAHLATPLQYGENIQPVRLPKALDPIPELSPAVLTGWGLNLDDGIIMDILQEVNITVYSDTECERLHAKTGPTSRIYHVCAGVPEGGKGQCNGDSGGPLVVDGTQIGIVSWSVKPCTRKGYPGVFTRVSTYIDWINCNLKRI